MQHDGIAVGVLAAASAMAAASWPAAASSAGSSSSSATVRRIDDYQSSAASVPAFVLFQTDGGPDNQHAAEQALIAAKKLPIFWSFVGFGNHVDFLRTVDDLPGAIDNTGFFHVPAPHSLSDNALYDGITRQFGPYLTAATAQGILP
ncbi:hypothetical protein GCM10010341_86170 [Streptomyces noursei]|nr:hypothetical protein GCM10010341_86170 [Streptomyces noursei]